MSKYDPLTSFLAGDGSDEISMSFAQIERVLGFPLPPASRAHRAWWSNNASNSVMTKAWLAAGYVSEQVDMAGERLTFRKATAVGPKPGVTESAAPPYLATSGGLIDRLQAALGGTVRVAEGVDLTVPTGEVWDAEG
jgi:hypothetical protein